MNALGGIYTGLYRSKARNPNAFAIYSKLVSWWTLDDNAASPTFIDSHGGHNMTLRTGGSTNNTNEQDSSSGPIQNVYWEPARQDNRAAYVPRSNTALDMTTDEDHCIGGWFKTGFTVGVTAFIMGRVGSVFDQLHFWIFIDPADSTIKTRYSANDTAAAVTVSSGLTVDSSTWHLVVANYDKTNSVLTIRARKVGGSLNSGSSALSGTITSTSNDTNFAIGEGLENDSSFDAVNNRNGVYAADECFYAKMAMTDTLFDYLYNSGKGRSYQGLRRDAA